MTTNFRELLQTLVTGNVEFIIVGGVAATAHGSARLTEDLDIVYRRRPENVARLVAALLPYDPYLRGAPPGLPFKWDQRTISNGLNFTLITALGAIDFLGEITGGGNYDDLLPHAIELQVFGLNCLCLGLERLIHVKRAAGRPKDFEAIAELEAILEERRQKP
ncbi:MAG: hypothetical protein V7641_747 [Blastocatellia bacterium]